MLRTSPASEKCYQSSQNSEKLLLYITLCFAFDFHAIDRSKDKQGKQRSQFLSFLRQDLAVRFFATVLPDLSAQVRRWVCP